MKNDHLTGFGNNLAEVQDLSYKRNPLDLLFVLEFWLVTKAV